MQTRILSLSLSDTLQKGVNMTVEKLPSGNYRIRQMVAGKYHSITVDHKPTKYEAEQLIEEIVNVGKYTLKSACDLYISSKSNVLSPATIREYKRKVAQIEPTFLKKQITDINTQNLQFEVNRYASTHSAKSTHDFSGFIMSVLKFYGCVVKSPKLPQNERKMPYIPTEEEVRRILEYIKGSDFEVPIVLASMGLRRSEICALTLDDLSGNTLSINKALVKDENEKWVIKATKTTDSTRTIKIPHELADRIREQGYIYKGYPGAIYNHLKAVEKKLGIEHFSLHKLRHFFASYAHNLGYTDKQIQAFGGWKTDNVMKTVYLHEMEMDKAKDSIAENFGNLMSLDKFVGNNQ